MSKQTELVVGGEPRVDLLPPEIRAARKTTAIRRVMTMILVGLVLVVAVATAGTSVLAGIAKSELEAEQAETANLFAQQQQYIEVRQNAQQIATIDAAFRVGNSTLVDWESVSNDLTAAFPAQTAVVALVLESATPLKGALQSSAPLAQDRIATLLYTVYTPTLVESEVWVRSIAPVEGVVDIEAQSVQRVDSPYVGYFTMINISIGASRLMNPPTPGASE